MSAGNFDFIAYGHTEEILTMVKELEPLTEPAKALAVICVSALTPDVSIDVVFNELKAHEGFKSLLTLLDYKTELSVLDGIIPDVVGAADVAEPYHDCPEAAVNEILENAYQLIDNVFDIVDEGGEVPNILKISDFGFKYLYLLALKPHKMTEMNILIDSAKFEKLILKYSDDFRKDLKEVKHINTRRLVEQFEQTHKNKIFKEVHDFEDEDPLSAALTIFDDNGNFKNSMCVKCILDFLLWYKNNEFGNSYQRFDLVKLNVQYCKHVAEMIFKKEIPEIIKAIEKGEEHPASIEKDYLNEGFLDYYWDEIKQEHHLSEDQQRDLNKYLDLFQYDKFKNVFDFDGVELYDKQDLNNCLKNFEIVFNGLEELILNIFFSESNQNTWGEEGLINVIKFGLSVQHYFEIFRKFKIGHDNTEWDILTKLADLLILHLYLKTYCTGYSFKNEIKEFLNNIKFYYTRDLKDNFNKPDNSTDSNKSTVSNE